MMSEIAQASQQPTRISVEEEQVEGKELQQQRNQGLKRVVDDDDDDMLDLMSVPMFGSATKRPATGIEGDDD
jgi:hypothetical protein